ncbi:DUF5658 family protein [Sporosalibacterium faouarense]|uniref:DUF5658 family protein n=1 Tax=Sporosalibacterium faouarense TaxID=516123 RepID=UPI003C777C96
MTFDYLISYWGIKILGYIQEANPLMMPFMELPLLKGVSFRIIYISLLLLIIKVACNKTQSPYIFNTILRLLLIVQIIPYTVHIVWIYKYFIY